MIAEARRIFVDGAGLSMSVDLDYVLRVIPFGGASPVPRTAPWFIGVCAHDGGVLPLVDPDRALGLAAGEGSEGPYGLVLVLDQDGERVGLLCKRIRGFSSEENSPVRSKEADSRSEGPAGFFLTPAGKIEERDLYLLDVESFFLYVSGES